ncbi:MAG: mechanosensitive ion channel [Thermoleophilia bacterium]|nr:mechanosensitive ion channel [Thermoleophilia bacterium]
MLDPIIDLLNDQTPLFAPWGRVVVVVGLFVLAWAVARVAARVAGRVLVWHEGRHPESELDLRAKIAVIKRRETAVAMVRTTIAYAAFGAAALLSVAQLAGGVDRLAAIAGSLFAVLVGAFVAQRLLLDLIAGLTMFVERWYSVGDTIVIVSAYELQGVVEDVSLRRTRLRAVNGEVINVHNSQVYAVKVLPSGVKELALELYVSDRGAGEDLVESTARMVPSGPTTFVRRPWIEEVEELSPALARITLRAAIAPGREWLAEDFLPDLLKERAPAGLLVHGPVSLAVDERAARTFSRASAAARWSQRALGERARAA